MALGHAGHIGADHTGQNLIGHFNDRGLNSPQIRQGFRHFKADGPGADNHGFFNLAIGKPCLMAMASLRLDTVKTPFSSEPGMGNRLGWLPVAKTS
jgi:hypothetical protein